MSSVLRLNSASGADLELDDAYFQRFKNLANARGSKVVPGVYESMIASWERLIATLSHARYSSETEFGQARAEPAGNPRGSHCYPLDLIRPRNCGAHDQQRLDNFPLLFHLASAKPRFVVTHIGRR
jgi:hypothetical protein